ncbi:hypothetical protein PHLGIDRAFT_460783 [Phlebiopsis gigantea 11061_1 CR5-6]|uniref:Uncharacterized protein n=1 Tax=Phlebiopsis gigantea (strain 11061_1 CR5-6) TaxID=745531 RepID=A0A0C3S6W0_PHLG1|nr:hypothetical protein PHLGIDRAFT_460783 [Phlebiopsis gigantea 11061_1 CR5-6]
MHDMAFAFTYPSPRHDSSHYAPVTTHSPRQVIAPCPHPGYQHDSSQVQARPPVFQLGSNYSAVPGGQFVQSSSTHDGIFGVAHDPLP